MQFQNKADEPVPSRPAQVINQFHQWEMLLTKQKNEKKKTDSLYIWKNSNMMSRLTLPQR